jgi:hypothetical protein
MTTINSNRNERLFQSIYAGFLLLSIAASVVSVWYGRRLFIYPAVTVLAAMLAAACFLPGVDQYTSNLRHPELLTPERDVVDDRVFAVLLFSTIGLLQLTYSLSGFNDVYYGLLLLFTGIFVILVLRGRWLFPLVGLLMLAILFRGHIWFSAPIFKKDPRLHTAIVGYMIERNELIPDRISYYRAYPIADIFAKEVALVLAAASKRAYFYAITVPAVLAAFVAFPAVRRVLHYRDDGIAVASVALLLFSAFHLVESSGPKPQTLSTLYFAVILLLLIVDISYRRILAVVFLFVLVKTHLLGPLIAIGLVASYSLVVYAYPKIVPDSKYELETSQPYVMAAALGIATLQQYHFVGHFRRQLFRILTAFQPNQGGAGSFISQAGGLTTTNVPLTLHPLLLQAGTLLVIGFLVVLVGFLFLGESLGVRDDRIEWTWVLTGAVLFALFAAGFFGSAVIRRGAAAVSVLTAPLVAFALLKLARERGAGTTAVFVVLLLSGTYLGFAHPGVLISERDNGFKPTLDDSEVESMEFVGEMDRRPYSFSYYGASAFLQTVKEGQPERITREYRHHSRVRPDTLAEFCRQNPDDAFVYRPYYETYARTSVPLGTSVIYSTDDVRVLTACGRPRIDDERGH